MKCTNCSSPFEISKEEEAFRGRLSSLIVGSGEPIPVPTLCPPCRQQRRFTFRNDRNFYQNACTLCRKSLISSYSSDKGILILCDQCFWSDNWDPLSFGQAFDFSRTFTEQFAELRTKLPRLAIYHTQSENSEYTVHSSRNRNCYMGSSLVDDEDVYYSDFTFWSRNGMDLFSCGKTELCYECMFLEDCYQCSYCELCTNLSDSMFCFDCKSSSLLVGCVGLRNKQNSILNQPATKEECEAAMATLKTDPAYRAEFEKEVSKLRLRHPHREAWMLNAENCTGNYIWNCKNVQDGYNIRHMEDVWHVYEGHSHKDTYDTSRIANGEVLYDCGSIVDLKYSAFCNLTYQCANLFYCDNCNGTNDSFGCMSLKKHKYCILNNQYTKEEYEALVPKIIAHMKKAGEWGEFFHPSLSPFGYNETKADEWYPLTEKAVKQKQWKWSQYEPPLPEGIKTIPADRLPGNIKDVPDDVLEWAILCEKTGKPFRIIRQELEFYRTRGLPIPRRSPKQRHFDRIAKQNPCKLWDRKCAKCSKAIKTSYSPDRPEKIFCEDCYMKEVY